VEVLAASEEVPNQSPFASNASRALPRTSYGIYLGITQPTNRTNHLSRCNLSFADQSQRGIGEGTAARDNGLEYPPGRPGAHIVYSRRVDRLRRTQERVERLSYFRKLRLPR
jgi:hypothetical protein